MSITRPYLLFITILVFQTITIDAQKISFKKIAPPKEFPFDLLIRGITQDTLGYMWITSGSVLYRYNGYEFATYKNNRANPNSLAGNNLETVYADKRGYIWVGTYGQGLDRLDPQTGIFTHFQYKQEDTVSLSNNSVTTIIEDHEGVIWVGTQNGLNRLDQRTGKFTRYMHKANDPGSLSNDEVRALYEDRSGTIWVGTGSPFFSEVTITGEGGLNRFDRKAAKFIRYLHDPKDPHSLIDNRVRAICEDSRGCFLDRYRR
jgi:ligand-binding sensor domain-containing protein